MVETDADILASINVDSFPDGQAVALKSVFGNSVILDADGTIFGAEAFIQVRRRRSKG